MLSFLSLFFLLFSPLIGAQGGVKIDPGRLPRVAASVQEFVPSGWAIEAQVAGDLNRDAIPDLAVTLVERMPADADKGNPPERQRALLILFKKEDGNFARAALANRVLLCTRCGGAFYGVAETPTKVEISNGVVIVKQDYGSRELTEETFRFRYEPESQRFAFIGVDLKSYDRLTGESVNESTNLLTGQKIVTKTKVNEQTGKEATLSSKSQRVRRGKKFIEDVAAGYTEQEGK